MLLSLELLALLQSCTRIEGIDPGVPAETAEGIAFAPDVVSTKGLLNAGDINRTGTKIKVYDFLSGFNGTINGNTINGETVKYFTDSISYKGETSYWPYWNPNLSTGLGTGGPDESIIYPWTKSGTHTFFGWLTDDGTTNPALTAQAIFGKNQPAFNESSRVLTIPTTTMTKGTEQFDFAYSDVVAVDAATRVPGSSVPLQLKHLFSAFRLTLMNTSGNSVLIQSITLSGMKNRRSATIDFSTTTPTVQTANLSSDEIPIYSYVGDDWGYEFVNQDAEITNILMPDFMLMWPQTYVELSDENNPAKLNVVYKVRTIKEVEGGDPIITDSDELTASAILNKQSFFKTNSSGMESGKKYEFMLQFMKSSIQINIQTLPWEYEEYDWNYADHSISARSGPSIFRDGVLAFYRYNAVDEEYNVEPTTDEWSAKTMRFNTRNEVMKGRFYIEAPTSGRWRITAYPMSAAQYFIVEPNSGDIDVNTDNGKAEFTVSINPSLTPNSTQTLYFNVAIYFNGEWHDADSEFNRKNIKLVLDAN